MDYLIDMIKDLIFAMVLIVPSLMFTVHIMRRNKIEKSNNAISDFARFDDVKTVKNREDEERKEAQDKIISDIVDSTSDIVPKNNSSFIEQVKSAAKTEDEIINERKEAQLQKIVSDAQRMLEEIKNSIMNSAQEGKVDKSGNIFVVCDVPEDYYKMAFKYAVYDVVLRTPFDPPYKIPEDSEGRYRAMRGYDERKYRAVERERRKNYVQILNEENFKFLIDYLCRLAAPDGIRVEKLIVHSGLSEYDFSKEILGVIDSYQYCLAVKCSCTIPQSTFDE